MHDPKTVAHEIKIGKINIITIWHVDPEVDGSDDSCGYSSPKPTKAERKIIDRAVEWDLDHPFYSSPNLPLTQVNPKYNYKQLLAGDTIAYVAAAWLHIAWRRDGRRFLSSGELSEIFSLGAMPDDNLRAILADMDSSPRYRVARFFHCVMRAYLRYHRPWWKHPKWHIHHWEIQIHPIQKLKRWLFSRCAYCGKGFRWGEYPISLASHSKLRWFKGEDMVYHHRCYREKIK